LNRIYAYLLSIISRMNLDSKTSELYELLQNKCGNAVTIMQYICPNNELDSL